MQLENSDASYLWDMLDAAKAVREFVSARSYEDYVRDQVLGKAAGSPDGNPS